MKKKLILLATILSAAMLFGCSSDKQEATETTATMTEGTTAAGEEKATEEKAENSGETTIKADKPYKLALITMDSLDQHWVTLNEGAQAEAKLVGVEVKFMSPDTKDDSKQIECVNNAVAGGVDGIMIAANGPDAISASLKEAQA